MGLYRKFRRREITTSAGRWQTSESELLWGEEIVRLQILRFSSVQMQGLVLVFLGPTLSQD